MTLHFGDGDSKVYSLDGLIHAVASPSETRSRLEYLRSRDRVGVLKCALSGLDSQARP